ncbi:hypothetical protein COCOBI_08-6050 [Coccomyxa sp. Obi]|nr:hypothetical protein COCOBI_08-6050 [Coccomyxa sp. Obi]
MTSEAEPQSTVEVRSAASAPSDEIVAAALEEALQNARLLRVSSSIFLKEAKELLDSGRAAALLWAADCLEGLNEVERERLAGVKEATETNSIPLVPVQSKKQLAEWVQLGKIGRLRRNAACLLAVVLHSADGAESDEAAALTKLLEHYPQAPKPLPKPVITQRVSSAGSSKVTTPSSAKARARHSYTPDPVKFRAAMASKDTLPVLKRTGSSAVSSRRESLEGGSTLPSWALSRRESLAAAEAAAVADTPEPAPAATAAPPAPPTAAPEQATTAPAPSAAPEHAGGSAAPAAAPDARAAATEPEQSDGQPSAPGPEGAPEISAAGVVSKAEPLDSSEEKAAEPAAAPGKKMSEKASSDPLAAGASPEPSTAPKESPQKPVAAANGNSRTAKVNAAKAAAPATASPVKPAKAKAPEEKPAAKALPEEATPAAKAAPASDAFTPGAGLPSSANATSAAEEATPQQTAPLGASGRAASVARPEEVSAFRMSRRKRTSSAAAAAKPAEDEATPGKPAENGSSIVDPLAASEEA